MKTPGTIPIDSPAVPLTSIAARQFAIVAGDFVCTGGMDRANYALASYLARTGNRVELVAHRIAPDLAAEPNVLLHRARKPYNSYTLGRWPLRRQGKRIGGEVAARGGRVVTNGGNCGFEDINWVHYLHAAYRPHNISSSLRRIKTVVEYPLEMLAERAALKSARLIICNSERTRRDVIEHIGIEADRTRVVYYGIDAARFFPVTTQVQSELKHRLGLSAKKPTLLFVGALGDRRKGFDTLFEAWRHVCKTPNWDVELLVVGCGAEMSDWIRRANQAGLHNRIRFLGFRTDVAELMQAADALISPTRYEAYGLGVHEAICCGIPAFVSKQAGVAERYPQELHGLLISDPNNPLDLAERLLNWRANSIEWRERVQELSAFLRKHSWDDMAKQLLNVID